MSPIPSYDDFVKREANEFARAFREARGNAPAPPDLFHLAWRRLIEGWSAAAILADLRGDPAPDPNREYIVRIHARDEQGNPVVGARVFLAAKPHLHLLTMENGTSQFDLVPGDYRIDVTKAGFKRVSFAISVSERDLDYNFTMVAGDQAPVTEPRRGRVVAAHRCFRDDLGEFFGLSATLFWGLWGMKHDVEKLNENLRFLAEAGCNSARVLGCVGPTWFEDREVDFTAWPDYRQVLEAFIDHAFDNYGIRPHFAIFGGTENIQRREDRRRLVELFAEVCEQKAEKVLFVEMGNESGWTGFEHPHGTAELRELLRLFKSRCRVLAAVTSPGDTEHSRHLYEGAGADIMTLHLDRDLRMVEGAWRPVRQPWEWNHEPWAPGMGANDEPIGPGSSVAEDNDPLRLIMAPIVSYLSGMAHYTYHTFAGIWGGGRWQSGPNNGQERVPGNIYEHSASPHVMRGFAALQSYLPKNLPNWSKQNSTWAGHPFHGSTDGQWWPGGHDRTGVVRDYAARHGNEFVSAPFGIRGHYDLRAARDLEFDQIDPRDGTIVDHRDLRAGQSHRLEGLEAYVIRGRFK